MSLWEEVKQLRPNHAMIGLTVAVNSVVPGVQAIAVLKSSWIEELNVLTLILVAFAISLPSFYLSTSLRLWTCVNMKFRTRAERLEEERNLLFNASLIHLYSRLCAVSIAYLR